MNDKADIEQRKHSLCGQINDIICYFGERAYGEFGSFHILHKVACWQLWAVICLYWMSCSAETPHFSRVVLSQIVQMFLLLLIMVFIMDVWTLSYQSKCFLLLLPLWGHWYLTRCIVSRYVDEHISPQLRASVLLLLELLFIRDGSFSCSLLSSHDIDELVDFICTSWCE